MKIKSIKVQKFNIELKESLKIALGVLDKSPNVLVEIETDNGITGIGEAAFTSFVLGDIQEAQLSAVENYLKPALIGEDPRDIERLEAKMDNVLKGNTGAKAAVDTALYDILGKIYQVPLYKLLGGYKNYYESDITIGIDEPEHMGQKARKYADEGYSVLKIKVGTDYKKDIERIKKIRESIGYDIKLRLDANQGWNHKEAIYVINKLSEYDIELVEQPVPSDDIDGLAFIRRNVSVPIMADESVLSPQNALRLIKAEAVDLINIKLAKSGGLFKAKKICDIAEAAGIQCMIGCMLESKIAITAAAHLAAACKNITRVDLDSPLYIKGEPVVGGVTPKAGKIYLSDEPGLGIGEVKLNF